MLNNLQNKINNNLKTNLIVCHDHSHPPIGNFHQILSNIKKVN